jgi:hypothetical protein
VRLGRSAAALVGAVCAESAAVRADAASVGSAGAVSASVSVSLAPWVGS